MNLWVSDTGNIGEARFSTAYDQRYLVEFIDQMETPFEPAISVNLPLSWEQSDTKGFPPFVYDITRSSV